jgi:opacity protein-like surface antigen
MSLRGVEASALGLNAGAGIEFPISHQDTYDAGVMAEVSWRKDPYELRFHFSDMMIQHYAVVVSIKHFFSDDLLRPFVEGGVGPAIVDTPIRGLAFGARPEAGFGADLGLSENLSFGANVRYAGLIYFGDTDAGFFEANHAISLLANVAFWF